ncbi:alpha/beta fold hydrolase [Leucobacter massiliensis]|uniref:Alpha/beta hydrolase n=1 Tax=Leucobacter massiliensis TaxID=1686285 RepID=A0A2S9QSN9_9MICO|nr:alpha/beta hydrolase [Leucobacter massiliensis]PRI12543.1 alpha/beta hydrolase [Leucobacter massiliensis]PRI12588.1 alpha/beta hydrolase [Leucobacter massiliensis]
MAGRDRSYERDGVRMAFTDTPGPGGCTFVLIHGIGMGRVVFSGVGERLAGRGRVLAPDLPGFGDSPEPGTRTSLEDSARFIARFIREEAREPVVLVGHSMGTQIAAEVALRQPELVRGLVLIAPTVNRRERSAIRQALRMVQDTAGEGPKVLLTGLAEYVKTSPAWFLNKLRFMLAHRLEDICPRIGTPALVLRGETDRVCPRDWTGEIAAALPHGRMLEIPGRGHEAIIKSPEPVASMILEFTDELDATEQSRHRDGGTGR